MVDVILGGFYGDEGKGKVAKYLAKNADIVVRATGGPNTSNSISLNNKKYNFRMIPTTIIYQNIIAVIANGVAIDPKILVSELKILNENGYNVENLKISEKAQVILPYHKKFDLMIEELKGQDKIGTTLSGVGPVNSDKINRNGIRVQDFISNKFSKLLKKDLEIKNKILECFGKETLDYNAIFEEYSEYGRMILPYVCDTVNFLQDSVKQGKKIICEGSQGTFLDIDLGTYPYVTSSNSTLGGVLNGTGLNFRQINEVYGVVKAYSTRDGEGPFLTEINDDEEVLNNIRELGHEYGSITKRPRRCGWLDLNALKYAVQINGITAIAINHLDVVAKLEKIKLCVAYKYEGKVTTKFSSNPAYLAKCEPIYEEFKENFEDVSEAGAREDLCEDAEKYLKRIEEVVGVPIKFIGIGAENENILFQ